MNCSEALPLILDASRGRLLPALAREMDQHVRGCATCQGQWERERDLDAALKLLDRPPLPASLALRLRGLIPRRRPPRWDRVALVLAAAACVGLFFVARPSTPASVPSQRLVEEAVNDHLRQLLRDRPVEVASSDHHQVKPWFAGRVDFAPVVHFEGDADFPLVGGSVGFFVNRKAAVLSYARRLHSISLLVMPASGLGWPSAIEARSSRGFNLLLWQEGDLAYALVSDLNEAELRQLAARIRAAE